MADLGDIARIALSLPGVTGEGTNFAVGKKALCWTYLARSTPKGRRQAVPGVIAVRCDPAHKEMLLEVAPERFFDDDHYRGYPAILVRLERLEIDELQGLLEAAWSLQATAAIRKTKRA